MKGEATEWVFVSILFFSLGCALIGYWFGTARGRDQERGDWLARALSLHQSIIVSMEVRRDNLIPGKSVMAVLRTWLTDDPVAKRALLTLETLDGHPEEHRPKVSHDGERDDG